MGSSPTTPTKNQIKDWFLVNHDQIKDWFLVNQIIYMFFVYFLKSLKNGKIYVGKTAKIPELRLTEHNIHTNTWTTQNGPFVLLYYESYCCDKDARRRELFYKTGVGRLIRNAIISAVSAKGGPAFGRG